jgi:hypothetical protein
MIYSITAKKDTTLYEWTSSINTGIDEVLEIQKTVSSSNTANIYNSRILINFDLSGIESEINASNIPHATQSNAPKYFINLYTIAARGLAYKYGLESFPVSQSWDMGKGRRIDKGTIGGVISHETEGASWNYRDGEQYFGTYWATQSAASSQFESGTTGSFSSTPGGSTWHIGYGIGSQSYDYEETDVRMDVTDIVEHWLTGSMPNEGFVIMRSGSTQPGIIDEERNGKSYGELQFFSTDTHTIYQPRLEVCWNDSYIHGGTTGITVTDENIVDIKNKGTYKRSDRARINIIARPKFPPRTYATTSEALTKYRLPTYSYWSVKDMITEETIIPFSSESTWISNDSNGSYFNLWMDQFYEERRYKFVLKSITGPYKNPTSTKIYDNEYTFKVIR